MPWRHIALLLVLACTAVPHRTVAGPGPEAGQKWLDRMSGDEALRTGTAWLERAAASHDFREVAWAEMLLKKAVADASARDQESSSSTLAAAYYHLGRALRLLGKTRQAMEALVSCAALRSSDRAVQAQLGAVAEEAQEWPTAIKAFSSMAAAAEQTGAALTSAHAFASLGWVLFRAGERAEALEAFRNASRLSPDDPQVHYRLARGMELHGGQDRRLYSDTGADCLNQEDCFMDDAMEKLSRCPNAQNFASDAPFRSHHSECAVPPNFTKARDLALAAYRLRECAAATACGLPDLIQGWRLTSDAGS